MDINPVLVPLLKQQIHQELLAWYNYKALATFFSRRDVGLKGLARYFKLCQDDELSHADNLIEHVQRRGGNVDLIALSPPYEQSWKSGLDALDFALDLERKIACKLMEVYEKLQEIRDPLIETLIVEMLDEQSNAEQELNFLISNAERCGYDYGELYFDNYLQSYLDSKMKIK